MNSITSVQKNAQNSVSIRVNSSAIDSRIAVYRKAIVSDFAFLKESKTLEECYGKAIYLPDGQGALVAVSRFHTSDTILIQTLADWRMEHAKAFPTQFPVTLEGTQTWLEKKLLDVPDRILFLVQDACGHIAGHIGFANCLNDELVMEIDNVVRGVSEVAPGIMSLSLNTLIDWANTTLWPESVVLRVLDDNEHAQTFYQKNNFFEIERQPLRKHVCGDVIQLDSVEAGDHGKPDAYFIKMKWKENSKVAGQSMILTAGPSISAREVYYATDATRHGWNKNWSFYINRFEEEFAKYVNRDYAIATSCCTGALHIALAALEIGPGDEVIVPDITWVATANAILYVGATPIFVDVEKNSWCLDPNSFESCITAKTKAVIPVHLYGHPCNMDPIMEIAQRHGLYVVEDAAPSIGAEYKGKRTGSFGHFAAFSFQGAKLAVTGEGGMLVTSDQDLYEKARQIWDQGRKPGTFWIEKNGLKYKMSNIQAAIGLGQIERNNSMVEAKRRVFSWYQENLKDVLCVSLNKEMPWARSVYWMTSLRLHEDAPLTRDALIASLKEQNIDSRPVFPAISQYPIWPVKQKPQPVAKLIGDHAINLPSGVCLSRLEVDYICECIRKALIC